MKMTSKQFERIYKLLEGKDKLRDEFIPTLDLLINWVSAEDTTIYLINPIISTIITYCSYKHDIEIERIKMKDLIMKINQNSELEILDIVLLIRVVYKNRLLWIKH